MNIKIAGLLSCLLLLVLLVGCVPLEQDISDAFDANAASQKELEKAMNRSSFKSDTYVEQLEPVETIEAIKMYREGKYDDKKKEQCIKR